MPDPGRLFDAFPDARFNIDLKSEGAVAGRWPSFIEARDAWDRVLVGSFSRRRLRTVPAADPAAGCRPRRTRSRWRCFLAVPSGRLADRLTGGRVAAFQIPHRRGR